VEEFDDMTRGAASIPLLNPDILIGLGLEALVRGCWDGGGDGGGCWRCFLNGLGIGIGTELSPSISSSSEFTSSTIISPSFRFRSSLDVAVVAPPLFLLVPSMVEAPRFECDALFVGMVLVVEVVVPLRFFLVTTVDVTVINAIPNCSSFVSGVSEVLPIE